MKWQKNLTNGAILKHPEFECDPACSSSKFGLGLDEPEKLSWSIHFGISKSTHSPNFE